MQNVGVLIKSIMVCYGIFWIGQFPLSVLVFVDSFVVSALQDASGYAISRQNNLELHLGYHTC